MEDGFSMDMLQVISDLDQMKRFRERKGIVPGNKDKYGYPYESFESFSTDPLTFNETGLRLQAEAYKSFEMMRILNRHSPLYIEMSRRMEKLIGLMGSFCITRAVLEQQGCSFPILSELTIGCLREMTAFNFRKAYGSYMTGIMLYNYKDDMLDLSIRWAALDSRLKATEEKIEKIRSGAIKVSTEPRTTGSGSHPETEAGGKDPVPFSPQERALPVDKAAVRELTKQDDALQPAEEIRNEPENPAEISAEGSDASGAAEEAPGTAASAPDIPEEDRGDETYTGEDTEPDPLSELIREMRAFYAQDHIRERMMEAAEPP